MSINQIPGHFTRWTTNILGELHFFFVFPPQISEEMPLIEEAVELQELNPATTNTVSVLKPRKNNVMSPKNCPVKPPTKIQ